jgi:4-amino-4-deoxy-L-arabinose transferase-like glycosyltransferase
MRKPVIWRSVSLSDNGALLLFGACVVLVHILVNWQYGFHRDELLTLNNARYLDWGYVVYPPMTAFLGRVELALFGNSLIGFRFFPALSQGAVLVLAGLIARDLGGKREAQLVAATAVTIGGAAIFAGHSLSYTTFDFFWWVVVAYFVARLLRSEHTRWWLAIGAGIGLGMMTKYTMGFLVLGILGGMALTPARRYFRCTYFWCGW